jgi:hypothetical protein
MKSDRWTRSSPWRSTGLACNCRTRPLHALRSPDRSTASIGTFDAQQPRRPGPQAAPLAACGNRACLGHPVADRARKPFALSFHDSGDLVSRNGPRQRRDALRPGVRAPSDLRRRLGRRLVVPPGRRVQADRRSGRGRRTGAIADVLLLPYWFWGALLSAAILALLWWSFRLAWRR